MPLFLDSRRVRDRWSLVFVEVFLVLGFRSAGAGLIKILFCVEPEVLGRRKRSGRGESIAQGEATPVDCRSGDLSARGFDVVVATFIRGKSGWTDQKRCGFTSHGFRADGTWIAYMSMGDGGHPRTRPGRLQRSSARRNDGGSMSPRR